MRWAQRLVLMLGVLVLQLLGSCAPPHTAPSNFEAWQSTVDSLAALHRMGIPEHLTEEDAVKTGGEFDVNEYFSILNRLSMDSGYVLDYVYCNDGMGGNPKLYARPAETPSLLLCSELDESADYLDYVRTDGTEEGFFQLVLLDVMGGQFYLFWHSLYMEELVVCTREGVEQILNSGLGSSGQKRAARRINPIPILRVGDEVLEIEIVTFSKRRGFSKQFFELNRRFPHKPRRSRSEVLVQYKPEVLY